MQNVIYKMKKIFEFVKKKIISFYEWIKDDTIAWIFKIAIIAIIIPVLVLIYKIILCIIPVFILGLLCFSDKIENSINQNQPQNQQYSLLCNFEISKNALFKVLKEIAHIYDLVTPKSLSSIVPVRYSSLQYINNLPFYRFIVLKSKGSLEYDFIV